MYIKTNCLRWAGHVIRLEEHSTARRVLVAVVEEGKYFPHFLKEDSLLGTLIDINEQINE
jgi:hypothetical protein